MLYGALIFAVAALVAGMLGFSGLASAASAIARVLFFVFVVMFLVTLVAAHLVRSSIKEAPATGGGRLRATGSSAPGEGRDDGSRALERKD
jgi:uncharacterized membrane protein YtjA (UPF0391 family)